MQLDRIVITGIGLTSPLGNDVATFRENLLAGKSGVSRFPVRNMGDLPAGVCDFEQTKYQKEKRKSESEPEQGVLPFIVPMKL